MKTLLSGSFILLVTALMVTLAFGCGESVEGETGSQSAELTNGECNAIVARSLGLAQQCNQFGCDQGQCDELTETFNEFFGDCGGDFFAGELNGLAGSALGEPGDPGPIQEVLCGANEACDPTCAVLQGIGLCLDTEACP
jgi:hypothetical protein